MQNQKINKESYEYEFSPFGSTSAATQTQSTNSRLSGGTGRGSQNIYHNEHQHTSRRKSNISHLHKARPINTVNSLNRWTAPASWHALQTVLSASTFDFNALSKCVKWATDTPGPHTLQTLAQRFDQIIEYTANTKSSQINAISFSRWMDGLIKVKLSYPTGTQAVNKLLNGTVRLLQRDELKLDARAIASALYVMREMDDNKEVKRLMHALIPHIEQAKDFNSQDIAMALYGMQNLTDSDEAQGVLRALELHISGADQLSPENIGMALYGLQNLTDSAETKGVLAALISHISKADRLAPENIAMALYGLQNLTGSNEAKGVLAALISHIGKEDQLTPQHTLTPQHISMVLYGLQKQTDSDETKGVLGALKRHISKADHLNSEQIAMALYGLKNQTASEEAKGVLGALKRHISNVNRFTPQGIGMALSGLQNQTASEEAKGVLGALIPHISKAKQLTFQEIDMALYGLQNLTDCDEAKGVLGALTTHISKADQLTPQSIAMALCGLQRQTGSEQLNEVLFAINNAVTKISSDSLLDATKVNFWLAESINSLQHYSGASAAADIVLSLYVKSGRQPVPERHSLDDAGVRQELIWTLLKPDHVKERSHHDKLDLHGLSHSLAYTFCATGLRKFISSADTRQLEIVFGRFSHRPLNEGKMREVVERLSQSPEFNAQVINWEFWGIGTVRLRKWHATTAVTELDQIVEKDDSSKGATSVQPENTNKSGLEIWTGKYSIQIDRARPGWRMQWNMARQITTEQAKAIVDEAFKAMKNQHVFFGDTVEGKGSGFFKHGKADYRFKYAFDEGVLTSMEIRNVEGDAEALLTFDPQRK